MGKDADKAKAAAAAATATFEVLLRSMIVVVGLALVKDSNCKRGCLKTKLLGFNELLLLLLLELMIFGDVLVKFEKTLVLEENEEESFELSKLKSLEDFKSAIKEITKQIN